ncbi:MAG: polyprenyl synthetase family protein [Candidatus Wallbacteria bacterium]|nr:polyprenyl synthetase family protein [Candidatus Wallbacteria bacterium]
MNLIDNITAGINRKIDGFPGEFFTDHNGAPEALQSVLPGFLAGGKRIRPLLFLLSYYGYGGEPDCGEDEAALGIELLHNFALIHDDLIDESDLRRDRPSLHHSLAVPAGKEAGRYLAIVAGDILFAEGVRRFHLLRIDQKRMKEAFSFLMKVAVQTGFGQFREAAHASVTCSGGDYNGILSLYDQKTGRYTFCGPLVSGAVSAGAGSGEIVLLEELGIVLGRAYQALDDLDDLLTLSMSSSEGEALRTAFSMPARHCCEQADQPGREFLMSLEGKKRLSAKNATKLAELLSSTGTVEFIRDYVKLACEKSGGILKRLEISAEERAALCALAGKVLRNREWLKENTKSRCQD